MSDVLDLTVIIRNSERAARAAEAALAIAQRLETDLATRLSAIEARMASYAAGPNSLERGILRITDRQYDHDGRFDAIEKRLTDHDARFDKIDGTLAAILAKLPSGRADP
jgi:hypothetical protein